jgi:hypothetical protein
MRFPTSEHAWLIASGSLARCRSAFGYVDVDALAKFQASAASFLKSKSGCFRQAHMTKYLFLNGRLLPSSIFVSTLPGRRWQTKQRLSFASLIDPPWSKQRMPLMRLMQLQIRGLPLSGSNDNDFKQFSRSSQSDTWHYHVSSRNVRPKPSTSPPSRLTSAHH